MNFAPFGPPLSAVDVMSDKPIEIELEGKMLALDG